MVSQFSSRAKGNSAQFTPNGVYFGVVKRVDSTLNRVWVELSRLAEGYDFGPLKVSSADLPNVGDTVSCLFVENRTDDIVVIGIVKDVSDTVSVSNESWKLPVRVATTTAGTLATSYVVGSVVDGVTLILGDRILLKNQTSSLENGIYTVNVTGAPTRSLDANTGALIFGAAFYVTSGAQNASEVFICSNTTVPTIGTTAITFVSFVPNPSLWTSTNRPTTTGTRFYEVDTGREMFYDGTGYVIMSEPPITSYVPTLGTGTGSGLTAGTVTFVYHRNDGWVDFYGSFNIGSAGSGATSVTFTTPMSLLANTMQGSGHELSTGVMLQVYAGTILTATGTFPGATGNTLRILGRARMGTRYL